MRNSHPLKSDPARWIWVDERRNVANQYAEFVREFDVGCAEDCAELLISVDTNFAVWLNGVFVGTGQFSDFPERRTFTRIALGDVLRPGRNILAVQVHYCGADSFSYIAGDAGLWYHLQAGDQVVVSDADTLCRRSPVYRADECARITPQLGFTFNAQASGEDGWRMEAYRPRDRAWSNAAVFGTMPQPVERPVRMLSINSRAPAQPAAHGLLTRSAVAGEMTVARVMQQDELVPGIPDADLSSHALLAVDAACLNGTDGFYVIADLGREECGFIELELDAPSGVVVDIAVGQHLADSRVRCAIGSRNFASRYVTRDGRQTFTHRMHRSAGRYVQLSLTHVSGPVTVHYAGLLPVEYSLEEQGIVSADVTRANEIDRVSRRTLHLCMHEHYEDTPWREQSLYANDARNQALAGYYVFGEYEFPKASFDLLGQSVDEKGYQTLCAPMRIDVAIPSFSMAWILALRDHLRYGGDVEYARKQLPRTKSMIETYVKSMADGLLPCPIGPRYLHFYDWVDGLSGMDLHNEQRPEESGLRTRRFAAPLNCFFVLALRAVAELAAAVGDDDWAATCRARADAVASAVQDRFWDSREKVYHTYSGKPCIEDHVAALTQALALLCDIPSAADSEELRQRLSQSDQGWVHVSLSQSLYKFEALLQDPDRYAPAVFAEIRRYWGLMLDHGATSFWETIDGEKAFDGAGSLCHGWSAIPAYFYPAYVLGIKPLRKGFEEFSVDPHLLEMESAEGVVPTPHGEIRISVRRAASEGGPLVQLSHPPQTRPVLARGVQVV